MPPADPTSHGISTPDRFDPDSGQWIRELSGAGPQREAALARLHDLLAARRTQRAAAARQPAPDHRTRARRPRVPGRGRCPPGHHRQARQFRGESKFTTWAYKFVIFEVSAKIGRHFWASPLSDGYGGLGTGCPTGSGSTPARETDGGNWPARLRRASTSTSRCGSGRSSSRS